MVVTETADTVIAFLAVTGVVLAFVAIAGIVLAFVAGVVLAVAASILLLLKFLVL